MQLQSIILTQRMGRYPSPSIHTIFSTIIIESSKGRGIGQHLAHQEVVKFKKARKKQVRTSATPIDNLDTAYGSIPVPFDTCILQYRYHLMLEGEGYRATPRPSGSRQIYQPPSWRDSVRVAFLRRGGSRVSRS